MRPRGFFVRILRIAWSCHDNVDEIIRAFDSRAKNHVGPDIKVSRDASGAVTEGTWGVAEKNAFIKKYKVTPTEADEMRKRALDLAYDTDGNKVV